MYGVYHNLASSNLPFTYLTTFGDKWEKPGSAASCFLASSLVRNTALCIFKGLVLSHLVISYIMI